MYIFLIFFIFFIIIIIYTIIIYYIQNLYHNKIKIPYILYINLDKRKDRRENLIKEFSDWNITPERISAVEYNPGWKGCSASHIKCIKIAIERDYPWVLIVEDDCILSSDAFQRFTSLLPFLWEKREHWDLFYGGPSGVSNVKQISDNPLIYEVYAYTSHFCLIHKSSYNKIIKNHPENIENYKESIDVYYANNFRIWTTKPYFAKQQSGISDIQNGYVNYDYDNTFNDKFLK